MFAIKYRYPIILLIGIYSYINTQMVEAFDFYNISSPKPVLLALFIVIILFVWEGNRIIYSKTDEKSAAEFWFHIAKGFAGSIVVTLFISLIFGGLVSYFTISHEYKDWLLPMKLLLMFSFRVNLFLNTINIIFLYQKQINRNKKELENYKRISSQAQLQSLKSQVNPHFLFNNLSVLSALIPTDTESSVKFVRQFSNVYRYILNSGEKELIPLKEEIDFLESYIFLLKTRFQDGLTVELNVSDELKKMCIIPVSLQLLVENAIKHNVVSKLKPLTIKIHGDNFSNICVSNNLQIKKVDDLESTKLGLTNIEKRYAFLGKGGVIIKNDGKNFEVSVPLIVMPNPEPIAS